jgi:hypothetical protein
MLDPVPNTLVFYKQPSLLRNIVNYRLKSVCKRNVSLNKHSSLLLKFVNDRKINFVNCYIWPHL